MEKKRLHCLLPFSTAIFIVASMFISCGVAISQGHVKRVFPFISYAAVKVPERCIFSFLINIGAFLSYPPASYRKLEDRWAPTLFLRYLQQREQLRIMARQFTNRARVRRLCIAALVVGLLSAFGLTLVANFQVVDMPFPHYIGAGFAFFMGLTYTWIQTSISFRQRPRGWVAIVQLLHSIFLSLCLVVLLVCFAVFKMKKDRERAQEGVLRPWYLASVISEWVLAVSVVFFLLTFCPSFSRITLQGPRVLLLEDRTYVTANDNTHRTNLSCNGDIAV